MTMDRSSTLPPAPPPTLRPTPVPTPAPPTPEPTPSPLPPLSPDSNWIKTDKQQYDEGETIQISFSRQALPSGAPTEDWIGAFFPFAMKPHLYLRGGDPYLGSAKHQFLYNAASMLIKTCGSLDCGSAPVHGTIAWSASETEKSKIQGNFGNGCYKLGLVGYVDTNHKYQIMASSEPFGIGPPGMTCRPPQTWHWHPASEGSQASVADIGSGSGFSVTARRFPLEAGNLPFTPLGQPYTPERRSRDAHPDYGVLKLYPAYPWERRVRGRYYGPGTHDGNYGQQRRFHAGVRSADGREGVIWKDSSSLWGTRILATWVSADMASAETQTLYTDPKALLGAAAFNADGSQAILFLWWHGKSSGASGRAKFVKIDCATGQILLESEMLEAAKKLGIRRFGKEKTIASMEWNSEENVAGLLFSGDYTGGHFGSCRAALNTTTMKLLYAGKWSGSHSLSTAMVKADDGSFLVEELNDNYPRGIQIRRFDKTTHSDRVVPYTFKTWISTKSDGKKWSNDNKVYSEIAYPGVVEVTDGLLVFFSGERPALNNSLAGKSIPRNVGFVKIGKDLKTLEVLSKGISETGEYWTYGGQHRDQKIEGINYLTNFTSTYTCASRVKTARLESGKILLYWEVWKLHPYSRYQYAQLMVVNDEGAPLAGPWTIDSLVALPQPDYLLVRSGSEAVGYAGQCDVEWLHAARTSKMKKKQCYLVRYAFKFQS